MAFKDVFRRVRQPAPTPSAPSEPPDTRARYREMAAAWLEAMERGDLQPPRDVHDADAWDVYWKNQIKYGPMDQGLSDLMSSDERLIGLLMRRGVSTVLCAGNGRSTEAVSLALHGFQVTALDLSRVIASSFTEWLRNPEHRIHRIPGARVDGDAIVFEGEGPIPREMCPEIHANDTHLPQRGGSLRYVWGDLAAADVCPGPFDAIIERRTVQLFPDAEKEQALDRLAARLAERGAFLSHMHDGGGGPNRHRPHHAREWARSRGFVMSFGEDEETWQSAPRVACVWMTTG